MAKRPKLGQYLEWQGNRIRVVVDVPKNLREVVGKTKLKASLGTDSPANAERLKWPIIARLKAELDGAARVAENPRIREALDWKRQLENAPLPEDEDDHDERGLVSVLLTERAEEIERAEGYASAQAFVDVASGVATPLKHHLETFIAEGGYSPRYRDDIRRAVGRLSTWCIKERRAETLEAMDRRAAGLFVSNALVPLLGDRKTINKDISALSSYWRWLVKRAHLEANPWVGQGFQVEKGRSLSKDEAERAFTSEEAAALLHGPASPRLRDVMWIAALSGMRLDEVCRLQVGDCAGGWFKVNARRALTGEGKTAASEREVPIHPDLAEIVERLSHGKAVAAPLIDGLPKPDPKGLRKPSAAVGQEFNRYRKAVGVDEVIDGRRRARVNFHSWRRWFVTSALHAGHMPHVISAVVGHEEGRKGMTVGTYNRGGPSAAQAVAVVESVKPPPVPKKTPADPSQDGPRKAVGGKRRGRPPKSSAVPKEG